MRCRASIARRVLAIWLAHIWAAVLLLVRSVLALSGRTGSDSALPRVHQRGLAGDHCGLSSHAETRATVAVTLFACSQSTPRGARPADQRRNPIRDVSADRSALHLGCDWSGDTGSFTDRVAASFTIQAHVGFSIVSAFWRDGGCDLLRHVVAASRLHAGRAATQDCFSS